MRQHGGCLIHFVYDDRGVPFGIGFSFWCMFVIFQAYRAEEKNKKSVWNMYTIPNQIT